jgi:protocatechuate 4,5-dioxygenase beta chain
MAKILGGIGTSHVPTIGGAYDRNKRNDPDWAPLFRGYEPVKAWLAQRKPDVLVFFYNDHATTFFFDHYPTFALGVAAEYAIADEGLGPRAVPPLKGHAGLARHMAYSLVNDEFDISVFQDLPIDHGVHSPLTMFWPPSPDWPGKIVPIEINVLQHPIPTPARCWKLGQAVRRAVLSYPEDLKVVIVGTGGLSHQMNGERAGFNNEKWDRKFLDLIARDPKKLVAMRHADYIRLGGTEGAEEIMWLAMRGALSPRVKKIHQNYYLPMTTAMAVALFEEPMQKVSASGKARGRTSAKMSS